MVSNAPVTNVARFIDERRMSNFQWFIIITGMVASILDGYDLASIGLALPFMGLEHVTATGIEPVTALGLTAKQWITTAVPVGMLIGSLTLGPLADHIGRRKLTILSIFLFGFFTLLIPHTDNWGLIAFFRFMVGIGSGGILPNLVPLIAEYSPKRRRATLTTITFSAIPAGSMIGAAIGGVIIEQFGTAHWGYIFDVGGIISLLVCAWCWFYLPESPRYLTLHDGNDEKIRSIFNRIAPAEPLPVGTHFVSGEGTDTKHAKASLARLFGHHRTATTLLITFAIALNTFTLYWLLGYLTELLTNMNVSAGAAVYANMLPNLAGFIGAIVIGVFMDRFNRFYTMAVGTLISALGALAIAFGYHETWLLLPGLFFLGFAVMGGQPPLYALLAHIYPSSIRGTGAGFGLGAGRTGSIIGPLVGGALLVYLVAGSMSATTVFIIIAVPSILISVSMWFLNRAPKNFGGDEG